MKYSKKQELERLIDYLFIALVFLVPLVFFTGSSEIFEFNKIIVVYFFTIVISGTWMGKMILLRRVVFQRSTLDYFLIFFLLSQILSTVVSIDMRTSFFGYYSRFHGGLLSSISYSVLYWAFVSNFDKRRLRYFFLAIIASTSVASVWAILEHFGISLSCLFVNQELSTSCWVQDVKNRPFATFGQPNWLAGWLVMSLPLTMVVGLGNHGSKKGKGEIAINAAFFILFTTALLFTKSRSGLLGFGAAFSAFWVILLYGQRREMKSIMKRTIAFGVIVLILIGMIGTPVNKSIFGFFQEESGVQNIQVGTVLENGGTESGEIRKIVWRGAFELWKQYPVLGTGAETFAYSYYETRPMEHNNVSEWNFLYNKAHNEYLNFLATTGLIGFGGYMALIVVMAYVLLRDGNELSVALFTGFLGILIVNFFGFSVVATSVLLFLYPGVAKVYRQKPFNYKSEKKIKIWQAGALISVVGVGAFAIFLLVNYWRADYFYSQGRKLGRGQQHADAVVLLEKAVGILGEPVYYDELGNSYKELGRDREAVESLRKASFDSRNVVLLKSRAAIYSDLAQIDPKYMAETINTLSFLKKIAPTDPSVNYRLGIAYAKIGQEELAIEELQSAVERRPAYKEARFLLGAIYESREEADKARAQYEYILTKISPDDTLIQKQLDSL